MLPWGFELINLPRWSEELIQEIIQEDRGTILGGDLFMVVLGPEGEGNNLKQVFRANSLNI